MRAGGMSVSVSLPRFDGAGGLRSPATSAMMALWLTVGTARCNETTDDSSGGTGDATGIRMTVVPAAPVSDHTRVEIRVGLENHTILLRAYDVQFFVDRRGGRHRNGDSRPVITRNGPWEARNGFNSSSSPSLPTAPALHRSARTVAAIRKARMKRS